jgi:hypothetical protein
LNKKYDERNHKQYVDEPTQRVGTHNPQQPQNQQDYKNCPKHAFTSSDYVFDSSTGIETTHALTTDGGPLVVYAGKTNEEFQW